MSEAEKLAAEVERKVWCLALAFFESDEARWDLLLSNAGPELKDHIIRAMTNTMVGLMGEVFAVTHNIKDPTPLVAAMLNEQVMAAPPPGDAG